MIEMCEPPPSKYVHTEFAKEIPTCQSFYQVNLLSAFVPRLPYNHTLDWLVFSWCGRIIANFNYSYILSFSMTSRRTSCNYSPPQKIYM